MITICLNIYTALLQKDEKVTKNINLQMITIGVPALSRHFQAAISCLAYHKFRLPEIRFR